MSEAPRFYPRNDESSLVGPGIVELLVQQGRIPLVVKASSGENKMVFCFVPSEDTKPGDTVFWCVGMPHFRSPGGEARKYPSMFILTPLQGAEVKTRTRAALEAARG